MALEPELVLDAIPPFNSTNSIFVSLMGPRQASSCQSGDQSVHIQQKEVPKSNIDANY